MSDVNESNANNAFAIIAPSYVPISNTANSGTTGRYLVLFEEDSVSEGEANLDVEGFAIANIADFNEQNQPADLGANTALVYRDLGVAVINGDDIDRINKLKVSSGGGRPLLHIEQEQIVYAASDVITALQIFPTYATTSYGLSDYLRGYKDGTDSLIQNLLARPGQTILNSTTQSTLQPDESVTTWGLQLTGVASSRFTGKGIKVAVLDTGLDLNHPDFKGRSITPQSFVVGESVQDANGHGTHCIGTACGLLKPGLVRRYGIAYEAQIFAGKVLNNLGYGADGDMLAGIQWALSNGCHVISMSIEAPAVPGKPFSQIFETVAQRALKAGALIIAAAGNDSHRNLGLPPATVGHPANCPSILSVGALDSQRRIGYFSNSGKVGIAGPGVNVHSSWPVPRLYNTISGTSMATPHVAGIAALHAQAMMEAGETVTGQALLNRLLQTVQRLELSISDVGAGFIQAPQ